MKRNNSINRDIKMVKDIKKNIPVLRFPEFQNDGEWIAKPIKDIAKTFSGGTPTVGNSDYYGGSIPFIRSGEITKSTTDLFITELGLSSSSAKIVEEGTILYALYGATSGEVAISKIRGAINQAILAIIPKSRKYVVNYIYYFLKHQKAQILSKYLQGGQGNLSGAIIDNLSIAFPCDYKGNISDVEQTKIADCFVSIDKEIDATKRKLVLLKEHKKGLMQRLFPAKGKTSPEIRFPEFIGTKEWTPKQLGFIGETFGGLSGKSAEDFGTGKPFVTYKQVFNSSEIDFSECALVQVSENEVQNSLQYGDILVTMSSETPDEVGYTAVVTNKNIPECYLNSFCFIYRLFDDESIDTKFLIYLFSNDAYRAAVVRIAQGITRFNISKTKFKEIELVIPENKKEQIKIAETLSSVDKQIAEYDKKIKALELHKKGLMQQLFPKL